MDIESRGHRQALLRLWSVGTGSMHSPGIALHHQSDQDGQSACIAHFPILLSN